VITYVGYIADVKENVGRTDFLERRVERGDQAMRKVRYEACNSRGGHPKLRPGLIKEGSADAVPTVSAARAQHPDGSSILIATR
jgi:hypothetical protein